ncbi:MAG: DUF2271 domain-containing protein [Planctomycetota bacterium]
MSNPVRSLSITTLVSAVLVTLPGTVTGESFVFHHENILGTSLELKLTAKDEATAKKAESGALAEIERLSKILSSYDQESELQKWLNGPNKTPRTSPELRAVLKRAEFWRAKTAGAFDVRAGVLTDLWEAAQKAEKQPDPQQLARETSKLSNAPYRINDDGSAELQTNSINLNALAKGFIIDKVVGLVAALDDSIENVTVNIGGDLRKIGNEPLKIGIADPANDAEGATPIHELDLAGATSLATSGGYRRFYKVRDVKFSHIIDPRSGQPVDHVASASVMAPNAMDADAAATAVQVLGPEAGLKLIETLPGFECLVVGKDGKLSFSKGWPQSDKPQKLASTKSVQTSDAGKTFSGLRLSFRLNRPKSRKSYRRPYVAIWLEDTDGYPVRTALLWLQTDQPGPRWHRDLSRWFRNDRMRKLAENSNLIGTISSATRGPGEYTAIFDGTDNSGSPLESGSYRLCIEAAREHGTYQIIRKPIELSNKAIANQSLEGNVEIGEVRYSYVPFEHLSKPDE